MGHKMSGHFVPHYVLIPLLICFLYTIISLGIKIVVVVNALMNHVDNKRLADKYREQEKKQSAYQPIEVRPPAPPKPPETRNINWSKHG